MNQVRGGYAKYIRPFLFTIDLAILNLVAVFFPLGLSLRNPELFYVYIIILWVVISVKNRFYEVYRFSKITSILSLIIRQFSIFFIGLYGFIGFFKEFDLSRLNLASFCLTVFLLIILVKFAFRFLLIKYRQVFRRNIRNVIVVGKGNKAKQLIQIFKTKEDFGFNFKKQFILKGESAESIDGLFDFVISNNIDEIYVSIDGTSANQQRQLIDFADINIKVLKFIPDNGVLFTRKLRFEYYDVLPILSLREIPMDDAINGFIKRTFDIIFSVLVFVCLLSWLMPLIGLIIYLDSQGPIFFKQSRPGFKEKGFNCYKFRSMRANKSTEQSAIRNDPRITKVGAFLRKTSLDELPQFINVLLGDMSVVGPRPHLWRQNMEYGEEVKKYMLRHYVKPGITGLAQTRGFRGEIERSEDIINRIRYDIFYIENWSLILDFRIIIQTVLNIFQGEDKAY
ncbi:exopolysaccharide biosynthesis polyprenyl glycosylphosphotransferase [Spongiivirga citrea]|uniref:Exopolysaccharide biosynthesis polyprenyl glycosylphosphotransferase n=1 Tax=Spongiivirga citrea TaxID=1481457 RepID=A0A6M0CLV4_9FLAO|nr:exopolysaccharide biosynthesis polyprenyl glycosylphosphotransferase [Spongiivirga citrea]NER18918.1 exopolysaccharide biosynthesis polyprenyl glycosylphosphotransferase [Spongiivirga citrea]